MANSAVEQHRQRLKQYQIQEAWHSFIDAKCRWRSDWLDGTGSNREPLGQRKEMKIHQGAITHKICCLAAQQQKVFSSFT